MSDIRVLHVASHTINVGDGALIQGMHRHLNRVAGQAIAYDPLDIVDFTQPDGSLDWSPVDLANYDLLLVGGGGTIDGKPSRERSGMAFPMSGREIRQSPTPLAFVAIGYNLFPGEPLHCRDALADVLEACRERGFPFSVRNDGSLARLQAEMGESAREVVEVPDPGFFVTPDSQYLVPQTDGRRPRVILQIAADNLERRLQTNGHRWFERKRNKPERKLVHEMAALVTWLVDTHQAEVILAPHITRDVTLTGRVLDALPPRISRPHVRVLGVAHPSHAAQFFQAYAEADLVIGMRGHSVICAVGLRVPCAAITTHDKVGGFMSQCGLQDWSIPWSPNFAAEIQQACQELLTSPDEYFRRRDEHTASFENQFETFMARVWNLVDRSHADRCVA